MVRPGRGSSGPTRPSPSAGRNSRKMPSPARCAATATAGAARRRRLHRGRRRHRQTRRRPRRQAEQPQGGQSRTHQDQRKNVTLARRVLRPEMDPNRQQQHGLGDHQRDMLAGPREARRPSPAAPRPPCPGHADGQQQRSTAASAPSPPWGRRFPHSPQGDRSQRFRQQRRWRRTYRPARAPAGLRPAAGQDQRPEAEQFRRRVAADRRRRARPASPGRATGPGNPGAGRQRRPGASRPWSSARHRATDHTTKRDQQQQPLATGRRSQGDGRPGGEKQPQPHFRSPPATASKAPR